MLKMRKENNGQCSEKNEKLCKVKVCRKIKRFFSSRVRFTPSFKGTIFIWGTKKWTPYAASALEIDYTVYTKSAKLNLK